MINENVYSLVFVPSGEVYKKFFRIIENLSKEYDAPIFVPHVTLIPRLGVSQEEAVNKTYQLIPRLRPFKIKLTQVDYTANFFTCLFVRAEVSEDLIKANRMAREIFNRQSDTPYAPHFSLLYGSLNSKVKEKIISKIGKKFNISFTADKISIFETNNQPDKKMKKHVIESWKIIKEIPFA